MQEVVGSTPILSTKGPQMRAFFICIDQAERASRRWREGRRFDPDTLHNHFDLEAPNWGFFVCYSCYFWLLFLMPV